MPTELELELEQERLQQLHERGDPTSLQYADRLQKEYHVRQMDGLAQDVYRAGKGKDPKDQDPNRPPQGWTRLSEHPEMMRKYAAQLHTTPQQLLRTLHPNESGFRAEIYLPDAALQQAGYKPTLAFKGSSGEVMT
ncbi:hypothetical protein [Rhodanobacter sp. L36]|uniref:hypothetical protein n=1 Tax=Rhodanobacter sp. L36 TaxID=1747221 RepID=UPI00131CEFF4|nr:hypothetical protein [Rhodanobacter sp. L36]